MELRPENLPEVRSWGLGKCLVASVGVFGPGSRDDIMEIRGAL
jgi:hypothetical protein